MTKHRNVTTAEVYAETARRDLAQNAHQQPAHGPLAPGVAGHAANALRDVLGDPEGAQSVGSARASERPRVAPGDVGACRGVSAQCGGINRLAAHSEQTGGASHFGQLDRERRIA